MKNPASLVPPGWLYFILLLYISMFGVAANELLELGMGFVSLMAFNALTAFFIWLVILPGSPKPTMSELLLSSRDDNEPAPREFFLRARLAGIVGAVLFAVICVLLQDKGVVIMQQVMGGIQGAYGYLMIVNLVVVVLPTLVLRLKVWWDGHE